MSAEKRNKQSDTSYSTTMKMKPLLILCMLTAGLLPMGIAFTIIQNQARSAMESATFIGL
jgi:hypothetical protein